MQQENIDHIPGFIYGVMVRVILPGLFAFSGHALWSQSVLVDHLFFRDGQASVSDTSGKILENLLFWGPETKNLRIMISVDRDKAEEKQYRKDLTRERLEAIIQFFIDKSVSRHIQEIKIVDAPAIVSPGPGKFPGRHKATIVIGEAPANQTGSSGVTTIVPEKPCIDTILTNVHSMIRIPGDSFLPENLPDYTIRVSEYTTMNEFMENNISTAISPGKYIDFLDIINLAILPNSSDRDAPATLNKPMVFMIKFDRDSSEIQDYRVFCQAKNRQSHISWAASPVVPSMKIFKGSTYLYFRINSTGLTGVGKIIRTNRTLTIRTPGFQQMKMTLMSPENRQVLYQSLVPDYINKIQIPGDQDFYIFIECFDSKGNVLTYRNRIGREQKTLLLDKRDFSEMTGSLSVAGEPITD